MNRRDMMRSLVAVALGGSVHLKINGTHAPEVLRAVSPSRRISVPAFVAGVRIVDSELAQTATEFSRTASPPYLFNHAMRTFLFASLVGSARGLVFDPEPLYLACLLHDLGLTKRFEGELPFEIQGAQAAQKFLGEQGYDKEKIKVVWDGIALHSSMVSQFKQPEIALVAEGAGADAIQPDPLEIKKTDLDQVLEAFPRLQFKRQFVETCVGVVRRHPQAATCSFMRDIRERSVPEFKPSNFCDRVQRAPFRE